MRAPSAAQTMPRTCAKPSTRRSASTARSRQSSAATAQVALNQTQKHRLTRRPLPWVVPLPRRPPLWIPHGDLPLRRKAMPPWKQPSPMPPPHRRHQPQRLQPTRLRHRRLRSTFSLPRKLRRLRPRRLPWHRRPQQLRRPQQHRQNRLLTIPIRTMTGVPRGTRTLRRWTKNRPWIGNRRLLRASLPRPAPPPRPRPHHHEATPRRRTPQPPPVLPPRTSAPPKHLRSRSPMPRKIRGPGPSSTRPARGWSAPNPTLVPRLRAPLPSPTVRARPPRRLRPVPSMNLPPRRFHTSHSLQCPH